MAIVLKYGSSRFSDAAVIRTKVFMEEQGYEDEFDDIDKTCIHVVAYNNDTPVGCARVFPEANDSSRFVIGRVAVLPEARERGIGRMLVELCEKAALEQDAHEMALHAQARLESWYQSMGYRRFGDVDYEDEGQPHVWMEKYF